jgi:hypothetical protein
VSQPRFAGEGCWKAGSMNSSCSATKAAGGGREIVRACWFVRISSCTNTGANDDHQANRTLGRSWPEHVYPGVRGTRSEYTGRRDHGIVGLGGGSPTPRASSRSSLVNPGDYCRYRTTSRVASSTSVPIAASERISEWCKTAVCVSASIDVAHTNAASSKSTARSSARWPSR